MIAGFRKSYGRWVLLAVFFVALGTWNPMREHELPPDTPWHVLMGVENASASTLPDTLRSLEGQPIVLTGFMYPLEHGRGQRHFLLSPYSPGCPFHDHGDPIYTVEVFAEESVRYTYDAVAVQGVFSFTDEGSYQLHEATVEDLP